MPLDCCTVAGQLADFGCTVLGCAIVIVKWTFVEDKILGVCWGIRKCPTFFGMPHPSVCVVVLWKCTIGCM